MRRAFAFVEEHFEDVTYGPFYRYVNWVFREQGLRCCTVKRLEPYSPTEHIPVVTFDQQPEFYKLRQPSIFLVLEPQSNFMLWAQSASIIAKYGLFVITTQPSDIGWLEDRTGRPALFLRQGYTPLEDPFLLQEGWQRSHDAQYDLAMPGMSNSPERLQRVLTLHNAGLSINLTRCFNKDLQTLYRQTRIFVNVPFNLNYPHFYTQRVLWAINMGACCVSEKSVDNDSEEFYKDLFHSVPREQLVEKCRTLVESGKWYDFARDAYERYRRDFYGSTLFAGSVALQELQNALEVPNLVQLFEEKRLHKDVPDGLLTEYRALCDQQSHLNLHLSTLHHYAQKCMRVAEFSFRPAAGSTCALVRGLYGRQGTALFCWHAKDANLSKLSHFGVKIEQTIDCDTLAIDLAAVAPIDMLFVDTWHVYGCLSRELALHAPHVARYILLQNTETDREVGESVRCKADLDEHCRASGMSLDEVSRGMWPALLEFLSGCPQWKILQHYTNCNGLTILERTENTEHTVL